LLFCSISIPIWRSPSGYPRQTADIVTRRQFSSTSHPPRFNDSLSSHTLHSSNIRYLPTTPSFLSH
jgi:hypothetical protein